MRKLLSLILSFTLLFCFTAQAEENAETSDKSSGRVIESGSLPIYLEGQGNTPSVEAFPVHYVNGVKDLPYVEIRDAVDFMNVIGGGDDEDGKRFIIDVMPDIGMCEIHMDGNASFLWLDFSEQTVTYTNFDTFITPNNGNLLDTLTASGFNAETGDAELFQRVSNTMLQLEGKSLTISMGNYNIPMIHENDLFLLPLHTAFALLLDVPSGGIITCISPAGIFLGSPNMFGKLEYGLTTDLGDLYYSGVTGERSPELAAYGLNEFCMEMDTFYGLKEAHGIDSFIELVINSGLMDALTDTNAVRADMALAAFLNYYLDDGHTAYNGNSPWSGVSPEMNPVDMERGFSATIDMTVSGMFKSAHEKFPDSKKPYYEVGNTAYIYQEQFYMCKEPSEYYNMEITEEDLAEDTIALIIYAHRQITRENSPIENVVIDLSCNGGGHVDTAVYMLCWFLGVAPMSITCPATGAQSTSLYQADINLDHKFDEKDTLAGKNLYCLTSELSFSCGNLVPCIFKASGKVTLIGRNTGGGSCVVMPMSTAWGTLYQTSGTKRISFVKNGSYYDVDRGVDPDVFLTKVSTFCDREKMTEIINNLY